MRDIRTAIQEIQAALPPDARPSLLHGLSALKAKADANPAAPQFPLWTSLSRLLELELNPLPTEIISIMQKDD